MTTRRTFGDQPSKKSYPSFSFGTSSREQAGKVFVSQEHTALATKQIGGDSEKTKKKISREFESHRCRQNRWRQNRPTEALRGGSEKPTAVRLELTRAEPIAFRVQPLNRSGTLSSCNFSWLILLIL